MLTNGRWQRVRSWLADWSIPRQLAGQDPYSEAAESHESRALRPRLEIVDKVGTSVCPYCAVGCGQLLYVKGNDIIQIEGDPRSPINEGTLCPKGAATLDWLKCPLRIKYVHYRPPYSDHWERRPLDWAMDRIAELVKRTRDETFVDKLPSGVTVNHTMALASLGGATLDNEENYLIKKLFGAGLGMVWIENQARVCHSASVPSLATTYGFGSATMGQWDLANSDCILIMGSNMAESHPVAFRFVMQAKEKGATAIHVDPRFTRTSAMCDLTGTIRAGTDIAFLGGVIHHVLENDLWFKDYAINYTNLATIIHDEYQGPDELGGYFSGWDEDSHGYKIASWQYHGMPVSSPIAEHYAQTGESFSEEVQRMARQPPPRDDSLQHPKCVYQILKRHYAAYTPEMVERVTGCPRDVFLRIADTIATNSGRERTTAICYANGWTHHTTGVQIIRAAAILQALLGNTGRPGGGIMVLRGHASIQGSTDVPSLYNLLPGYLAQPRASESTATLDKYLETEGSPTGWWVNMPKYMVSLLRAYYGHAATPENEWGYQWIPKITGDHSQLPMTLAINDGLIKGLFVMGQNPAVGGQNAHMIKMALPNLEWMVVRDVAETETASYWYKSPEVERGELRPEDIQTEIFLLPAALPGEKEGTFTNTQRLIQWHDKVVEPPGDCRSEHGFLYHLGKRLKRLYAYSTSPHDEPIKNLTWDYPTVGPHDEPDAEAILKEINGYTWPDCQQIPSPSDLRDDGSTACGVWLYCGIYPKENANQARRREPDGPEGPGTHLGWGFSWPENRRILYNRASADPAGRPWSERKKYMVWNPEQERWEGPDVPDFPADKPPDYEPDFSRHQTGLDAHDGRSPFRMIADGKASLFTPSGLKDGPLPTHYEPVESPVRNLLYECQDNPAAKKWERDDNPLQAAGDPEFPYVITTHRLTEHQTGGLMSRIVPHLAELQPQGFCEIPPELASEKGIRNLDWVVLWTKRGEIKTRALVTERAKPLVIDGRRVYQIGVPWVFGPAGYATGESVNHLSAVVGDPNTAIHESKAFTCNLRKA